MNDAPYTHKEVPLLWLRAFDEMQGLNKPYLSLDKVNSISISCGLHENEIEYFIRFLHEMGMLMWCEEPGLREIVIMDPIAYLVTPATTIICKHKPEKHDVTNHKSDIHIECDKLYPDEWHALIDDGLLDECLFPILWRNYSDQINILIQLMIKFGLFVPLVNTEGKRKE